MSPKGRDCREHLSDLGVNDSKGTDLGTIFRLYRQILRLGAYVACIRQYSMHEAILGSHLEINVRLYRGRVADRGHCSDESEKR